MVAIRRPFRLVLAAFGTIAIAMCAAPAHADTFGATELSYDAALLSQFNLVTLSTGASSYYSNPSTAANTNGRVIIGGSASFDNDHVCYNASTGACVGNATKAVDSTGQLFGAVTVFGNITNSYATLGRQTGGGDVAVQGTTTGFISGGNGKFNLEGSTSGLTLDTNSTTINTSQSTFQGTVNNANGTKTSPTPATPNVGVSAATVFPFSLTGITTEAKDLYSGLANLPGTPGVKADALPTSNSGAFTSGIDYTANGKSYGVVTTTLANFEAQGSSFTGVSNNSSNAATFVIITGSGGTLPTITTSDPNVIYDFVGASTLATGGVFDGSILAPFANLTQGSNAINGTVVVASMTQNADLYNTNAFTGDLSGLTNFTYNARVPEPTSLVLLGSGIAGLAWGRRKRRRQKFNDK
jgi:choice-of-anchor A domain-containing protein